MNSTNKKLIKGVVSERHLSRDERAHYHAPDNDWEETTTGEVCINASSLPISDIIKKHKL